MAGSADGTRARFDGGGKLADVPPSPASEELARAALEWLEATAVADGDGVWWSGKPSAAEPDPTLYHGTAGIVLALLEADAHFSDRRWDNSGRCCGTGGVLALACDREVGRDPSYAVQWPDHPAADQRAIPDQPSESEMSR